MAHWSPDLPPAEVYAWGDERLDGLVRAVNDAPEVALDTETTGLNNMRDHAVIWSLAFGRRRICMKADTLRAFTRTFLDPSRTWIFHNAKFDAHMLANLGYTIAGRWLDTAVMHALLYEETSHKLKDVHKQMFGWSWASFKQTFGNFPESETARVLYENWENSRQKVIEYASNDAYGTLNVKTKLYDELEKELVFSLFPDEYPHMLAIYEKTEAPFTKVLWKCERAGMKVDFDYLQTIADPVNEELARVQRETTRLAGELVNIDSPAQLRRLFFDKLKLTPTHYTKGGKKGIREPSTDADFLEANADQPICASILRERELGKLKGTYIDTLPTLVDQHRRMHPTYNQDVARTGRLSAKNPNSQNFPNTDNDKFGIRGAFTCEPGNTLIVIDYCLTPGTRLLHSDLTWRRIDETSVGDELIGFDEELKESKFKRTRVTSVKHLERPCITVVTDRGTVTASTEHLWVVRPARGDRASLRRWLRTDELQPGDRISFFVPPWETDRSYGAGYLAGVYDGEGWVHQSRVSFAQNDGVVLDKTTDLLRERGFETSNDDTFTCRRRTIANGDALRFLGTIRPARLLPRAAQMWEGRRTWGRNSRPATVLRVEGRGVQPVVAVGTTSRTFIAEGFLSHNCALEMRLLAAAAGEPDMLRIFQEGKDIHMGNASMVFGLPYEDLVKAKKTDKLVKEGKLPPGEMTEYFRECLRRRSQVKSVGFGMNYGLKENKLAQQLGITKDEALDLMRRYMERYPTVEHFYKSAIESCKETCRAYSILGRRRYLPEIWSNKSMIRWQAERRAVNMEIQGGAADVVRLAMLACDDLDLEGEHGCYMLAQIHDELVFECPIEEADEAKGKIIQAMMHPFPRDLPVALEVSAGTGPNWKDAK